MRCGAMSARRSQGGGPYGPDLIPLRSEMGSALKFLQLQVELGEGETSQMSLALNLFWRAIR